MTIKKSPYAQAKHVDLKGMPKFPKMSKKFLAGAAIGAVAPVAAMLVSKAIKSRGERK